MKSISYSENLDGWFHQESQTSSNVLDKSTKCFRSNMDASCKKKSIRRNTELTKTGAERQRTKQCD